MTAQQELGRRQRAVHPFPARMAPEIALEVIGGLRAGSTVVDPMCGSGVVLREAVQQGHEAVGVDVDPLAVLMSKVWTRSLDVLKLLEKSEEIIKRATYLRQSDIWLPWIDEDEETAKYIEYWFASDQKDQLRKLSYLVAGKRGSIYQALQLAISRLIVTKKVGASLAWDVSHSRPHRVKINNDYDVLEGFKKAVAWIAEIHRTPPLSNAAVRIGDARRLATISDKYADVVITSPPYFNAIDYIRGHRLALVWLGYRVSTLRRIRLLSVGREKRLSERWYNNIGLSDIILPHGLDDTRRSHLRRYVLDMFRVMSEIFRILKPMGQAVLVVGGSNIGGQEVDNPGLIRSIGQSIGLRQVNCVEREIPSNRRYLPPPTLKVHKSLQKRMRVETVLTLEK